MTNMRRLEKQFGATKLRRMALYWLFLGMVGFAFCAFVLIGHFAFGMAVHEAHKNRLATSAEILVTFGIMALGSSLFGIAGAWLRFAVKPD
ncbi:MAG: hypothetical protein ACXU8U_00475 [Asticcacaulis sp.]